MFFDFNVNHNQQIILLILNMIDVLIIIAYLLVVMRLLLRVFGWFQERFDINGIKVIKQNYQPETPPKGNEQNKQQFIQSTSLNQISSVLTQRSQKDIQKLQAEYGNNDNQNRSQQRYGQKQAGYSAAQSTQADKFGVQQPESNFQQQKTESSKQHQVKQNRTVNIQIKRNCYLQNSLLNQLSEVNQKSRDQGKLIADLKVQISNLNHKISQATQRSETQSKVFNELKVKNNNLSHQLEGKLGQTHGLQQSVKRLSQQLIDQKKQYDGLILQMRTELVNSLQQTKKYSQVRDQLQNITDQTSGKPQNIIQDTVNETISMSNGNDKKEQENKALSCKIQSLQHEVQFLKGQVQSANAAEKKLLGQNQKLNRNPVLQPRGQISISQVINHGQYIRVKQKLHKYESGMLSSRPMSVVWGQLTPQGERLSKAAYSRISERRSFMSSRLSERGTDKGQISEDIFGECSFLNGQSKVFLSDQIKKIKKLAIKKTKLIFRLDKLNPSNPHEFIDNIPNILLLVELTNKKVLAAFTQLPFSRQDVHASKGSVLKSRLGSNRALIVDLTNKVALHNKTPNQTITYDQNAVVWGRDEMVLKNDEPTLLYSSMGSQQGVYCDGKYTVQQLLGGSQGFERINQYEFHRIYIN